MALSTCPCNNNKTDLFVKIVFPGGRVELHDHPLIASEIMQQYPKCSITYPNVFQQPWAVVAPDEVLLMGKKFYVVPSSTLRKLRRVSRMKGDPSPGPTSRHQLPSEGDRRGGMDVVCWLFVNAKIRKRWAARNLGASLRRGKNCMEGELWSDRSCLISCLPQAKTKRRQAAADGPGCNMELNRRTQRDTRKEIRGSSNRRGRATSPATPAFYWQPSLESINEE